MWPNQRDDEENKETSDAAPSKVEQTEIESGFADFTSQRDSAKLTSSRRASESIEAFQRRTQTELNLIRRNEEAKLKKLEEKEAQLSEEEKIKKKRAEIKKRKEEAKKIGRRKKKKKAKKEKKPLSAAHCSLGDVVLSQKGIAVVRWKGILHFRENDTEWLGIEFLDEPRGKNDGKVKGKRYFQTKPKHGSFVKVVKKKLAPEEILLKLGTVKSQLRHQEKEFENMKEQFEELQEEIELMQEKFEKSSKPSSPDSPKRSLHLDPSKSLRLVKSISGTMDTYTTNSPNSKGGFTETTILQLKEVYDDSSSSEYEFSFDSSSDEEEEVASNTTSPEKSASRKKLVDVAQSHLYSQGSLQKIQNDMLEQMEQLKNPAIPDKRPGLRRQTTFATTTQGLGLGLPELHSTQEEIKDWVKENLVQAPNCPDLENTQVLGALCWAMKAFLNLNESHSY